MRRDTMGFLCLVLGQTVGCGSRTGLIAPSPAPSVTETAPTATPDASPEPGTCGSGILTLASGLPTPYALAVNGTSVYWTGAGPNFVSKVGTCGGAITVLSNDVADANSPSILVDAANVYWASADGIRKTALNGGPIDLFAPTPAPASVVTDGDFFYWLDFSDYGMGSLVKMPFAGGAQTILETGLNQETQLAVDGTSIYWTEYDPGYVNKTSLNGGPVVTLVAGTSGPYQIVVHGDYLYWTNIAAGGIFRLGINGGGKPYLFVPDLSAYAIAVDDAYVYWTSQGTACGLGQCPGGSVKKVPIGGGTPITLAPNEFAPGVIAVDSTSVYWTNSVGPGGEMDGSLRKLTPK